MRSLMTLAALLVHLSDGRANPEDDAAAALALAKAARERAIEPAIVNEPIQFRLPASPSNCPGGVCPLPARGAVNAIPAPMPGPGPTTHPARESRPFRVLGGLRGKLVGWANFRLFRGMP